MSQLLPSQEREREERRERRLEREKWRFCFSLAHSWTPLYLSLFKVYLSHLDVASPHGFILHVD